MNPISPRLRMDVVTTDDTGGATKVADKPATGAPLTLDRRAGGRAPGRPRTIGEADGVQVTLRTSYSGALREARIAGRIAEDLDLTGDDDRDSTLTRATQLRLRTER